MKKKIKDLTVEEKSKICLKYKVCHRCPLYLTDSDDGIICHRDIDLEREVEIDE